MRAYVEKGDVLGWTNSGILIMEMAVIAKKVNMLPPFYEVVYSIHLRGEVEGGMYVLVLSGS